MFSNTLLKQELMREKLTQYINKYNRDDIESSNSFSDGDSGEEHISLLVTKPLSPKEDLLREFYIFKGEVMKQNKVGPEFSRLVEKMDELEKEREPDIKKLELCEQLFKNYRYQVYIGKP